MSISIHNIELKTRGFLIQYSSMSMEFLPFSQVKSLHLNLRKFENKFEVHVFLSNDGIRVIQCENEEQTKNFFNTFIQSL